MKWVKSLLAFESDSSVVSCPMVLMPLRTTDLSLIPVIEKYKTEGLSGAEAADQAFKARLRRMELEAQVKSKLAVEKQRREVEAEEARILLKKIETQREKERRAYLQEIAEIDKQSKLKDDSRLRHLEVVRRLEEIRIDEAIRKDEEALAQTRLLELHRPSLSSCYYRSPWVGPESRSDLLPWFHSWQSILHQMYFQAPVTHLQELSKNLDTESVRIREVIRQRFAQDVRNVDGG